MPSSVHIMSKGHSQVKRSQSCQKVNVGSKGQSLVERVKLREGHQEQPGPASPKETLRPTSIQKEASLHLRQGSGPKLRLYAKT